ncbi:hypothetical protein HAX54_053131 [Datura stramonium]|uniref:DUF4283 domain-containing protein n=1 Tax=Datura stramonium TaxID=4076 RepID=A0ABS8SZW2_DATST|nr:hypothetical protein [Datura stramonium]
MENGEGAEGVKAESSIFLFCFTLELEATRMIEGGQRWMSGEFTRLERWHANYGCVKGGTREVCFAINIVGVPIHLWCPNLFKEAGDLCAGFVDLRCCMSNMSRVKVYVKNGGKFPASTVLEDGRRSLGCGYNQNFSQRCWNILGILLMRGGERMNEREKEWGRSNQIKLDEDLRNPNCSLSSKGKDREELFPYNSNSGVFEAQNSASDDLEIRDNRVGETHCDCWPEFELRQTLNLEENARRLLGIALIDLEMEISLIIQPVTGLLTQQRFSIVVPLFCRLR